MKTLNKLTTLAALTLLAGASALSYAVDAENPQADAENLMANWLTGQVLNETPKPEWYSYHNNTLYSDGTGNGWQIRNANGELNGSGEPATILLRYNDSNSTWLYGYKMTLEGGYEYNFTMNAKCNEKVATLYLYLTDNFANLGESQSQAMTKDYTSISKTFKVEDPGDYYLVFSYPHNDGNAIIFGKDFSFTKGAALPEKTNYTDKVGNTKEAWNGTGEYNVQVTDAANRTAKMIEHYYNGDVPEREKPLYQTIEGLPAGDYTLTLYATALNAWKSGDSWLTGPSTETARVYATCGTQSSYAPINADKNSSFETPGTYTLSITVTEGQPLEFGIENLVANSTEWFTIQIKSLIKGDQTSAVKSEYEGLLAKYADLTTTYPDAAADKLAVFNPSMPENPTAEDYQSAIDAMNNPDNLRAVVESNALAEAIADRTDYSEKIQNPDFQNQSTDGWTAFEGSLGTNKGEEPTLADGSKPQYFDRYDNKTFRVGQTLTDLPAGKYRLSLLARGSDINWFRLRVMSNVAEDGSDNTPYIDLPHYGNTGQTFGLGWNMAYLDFDFTGGDLLFSVNGNLGSGQWAGFTHVRIVRIANLDVDPNQLAYEQALATAKAAIENDNYVNITGNERTELVTLTTAETPADSEAYKTAAEALTDATSEFTSAKESYDLYAIAKNLNIDALTDATNEKKDAFNAAIATTPNTAAEAAEAATKISTAYKIVVESHSVAEGIEGATDYTAKIVNPKAENGTEGWTLAQHDGGGNIGTQSSEKPILSDNTEVSNYFDGGNWGGNDWTTRFEQTTTLPVGKYRLAVLARGETDLRWFRMHANNVSTDLSHNGGGNESKGTFGRGWEDHALDFNMNVGESNELLISIQANAQTGHQWQSFTNFRLTKIGELENHTMPISISSMDNASFAVVCLPYAATVGKDCSIYRILGFDIDNSIKLEAVEDQIMQGGIPYLVVNFSTNENVTFTFGNKPSETPGAFTFEGCSLQGTFVAETLSAPVAPEQPSAARRRAVDNTGYTLYTLDAEGKNFVKISGEVVVPANSAYLRVPNDVAASLPETLNIQQDVATGINGINADIDFNSDDIYDLQGRRVVNPAPGIYVHNGKKILIRK